MICSLESIKLKEVIDIETGERLGYIDDAEFDLANSQITALVIYGRKKFLGLFGKEDNINIPCANIKVIGDDVILIVREERHVAYSTDNSHFSLRSLFK